MEKGHFDLAGIDGYIKYSESSFISSVLIHFILQMCSRSRLVKLSIINLLLLLLLLLVVVVVIIDPPLLLNIL